ncbi:hypothetical protein BDV11DRAFT_204296 [Aspergillus similis]
MQSLTLHRGWLEPNRYVWYPFVVKLEARLRIAGVPYKTASGLNAGLSHSDQAHDLAARALLEDKVYFYNMDRKLLHHDHVLSAVPDAIRILIGLFIYRSTVQTLHGQGTGRYSADEIEKFREEAWGAVNDLLVASKVKAQNRAGPFWVLGGEKPTEADATVFGFVVSALICEAGPKTKELAMGLLVTREYARRIHDTIFRIMSGMQYTST